MNYTALKDRVLWFDGDSAIEPDYLADLILKGTKLKDGICVSEITKEIEDFNLISEYQLTQKTGNRPLDFSWNIPSKYLELNLRTYMLQLLEAELGRNPQFTDDEVEERIERVNIELETFYQHNVHLLLRTTLFIVDTFREQNVVWGVGRGSACSSYILYLAGVHDIDSIKYELDIGDFLR